MTRARNEKCIFTSSIQTSLFKTWTLWNFLL